MKKKADLWFWLLLMAAGVVWTVMYLVVLAK